jgi:hypothetical protein
MKKTRPPLRSATELAEELGISVSRFGALLGGYDGPKHKLSRKNIAAKNSWFDRSELLSWWNTLPIEIRTKK